MLDIQRKSGQKYVDYLTAKKANAVWSNKKTTIKYQKGYQNMTTQYLKRLLKDDQPPSKKATNSTIFDGQ